jgi:alpha-mannosidase
VRRAVRQRPAPTHPTTTWDAAKFEVCAHRYVDIAEPGLRSAILNNGRYGHGVFDGQVRVSLAAGGPLPDPDADQGRTPSTWRCTRTDPGSPTSSREAERFNRRCASSAVRPRQRSRRRSCR